MVLVVVLAGGWLVVRALSGPDPVPVRAANSAVPPRPPTAQPLTVRYVYDGDTIQAQASQPGEHVTTTAKIRIRLIGIDTPEVHPTTECFGPEATARLQPLVGGTIWVAPDRDSWDAYGRRLFLIWTSPDSLLNHDLVVEGYAEAIRIRPNVTYWPLLRDAAATAQEQRLGRWGAC